MEVLNLDNIEKIWPVLMFFLGCTVWLIRLESKVLYLERDRDEHWQKLDAMQIKLQEIAESLARLEGKLDPRSHE